MEKIALYRKYRPQNFDNLVGQEHIKTTLMNAFKSGNVSHAYLFTGPRGTGKTSTARLIAKALNCSDLKDNYEPCDKCEFCTEINDGRLIDIIEIDAASNRGIDEVRDLKEKIQFSPTRSKYKVYIIDEVHMMTKEAFNALLKTLEEPPAHAYFILATTESHKIPETIISRCQRFDFKRVTGKAITTRLNYIAQIEGINAEEKALEAISRYVDGGMRDAIGLVEQLTTNGVLTFEHVQEILGITSFILLEQLYAAIEKKDVKDALRIVHDMHDQGSDLKQFVHEFIEDLRSKLIESVMKNDPAKSAWLIKVIEAFQFAYEKINTMSIPQLPLEIAIIRIAGDLKEEVVAIKNEEKVSVPATKIIPKKPEPEIAREHAPVHVSTENVPAKKEEVIAAPITPSVKPVAVENGISPDFSLEKIVEGWPRIVERAKAPALRMSVKNASPFKLEGSDLTLAFASTFHKDKVMEHDYRTELEEIIAAVFGHGVKILSVIKDIEIKSVVEEKDNSVDDALEIFGGEVID